MSCMHGCTSTFACHTHTHKHTPFILTLENHTPTTHTPNLTPPHTPPIAIARFMYECDIQFVHADHPAFKRMIKAVAQAGPAFQPPDAEVCVCVMCVCVCVCVCARARSMSCSIHGKVQAEHTHAHAHGKYSSS